MPGSRAADVAQQRGVGAVEAVDRLGRIADEVEVAAAADEQLEQPVLERVEVLGLVDEHVAVAEPHGVGPLRRRPPAPVVASASRSSRSTTPRRRFSVS